MCTAGTVVIDRPNSARSPYPREVITITTNDNTTTSTSAESVTAPKNLQVLVTQINQLPHGYQILGTLLLGGGVTAAGYGLSQLGLLDLAATFITCFMLTFFRLVFDFTKRPKADADFAKTRAGISAFVEEFDSFMKSRAILGKAIIATGYAMIFLAARWVVILLIGLMANVWIAVAVGLVLASVIASPILWRAMSGSIVSKVDGRD